MRLAKKGFSVLSLGIAVAASLVAAPDRPSAALTANAMSLNGTLVNGSTHQGDRLGGQALESSAPSRSFNGNAVTVEAVRLPEAR